MDGDGARTAAAGGTAWYAGLFAADYLRLFGPLLDPEDDAEEAAGVTRLLGLPAGARILDLACGWGRHAMPLARWGYAVSGLDLSHALLRRARAEARAAAAAVGWVRADMRALPFDGCFDAVVNLFNSFGYFDSEEQDRRVLAGIARALRPGGRFLQEVANREALVRERRDPDVTRYDDGLVAVAEQRLDLLSGRNRVTYTLFEPDGRRRTRLESVRAYTLAELADLHAAAGLTPLSWYGGLCGEALTAESPSAVLLSRRA